jgi:hypothetical protein
MLFCLHSARRRRDWIAARAVCAGELLVKNQGPGTNKVTLAVKVAD